MMRKSAQKIEVVYDDECPVCRTYCCNLVADDGVEMTLIDARKDGELMREVTARGLDIDEGMVLKTGDKIYYGSDAMYQIALRARKNGFLGWVNRHFFGTERQARVFYPAGKALRNVLLRLMGIKKINNLKAKP